MQIHLTMTIAIGIFKYHGLAVFAGLAEPVIT